MVQPGSGHECPGRMDNLCWRPDHGGGRHLQQYCACGRPDILHQPPPASGRSGRSIRTLRAFGSSAPGDTHALHRSMVAMADAALVQGLTCALIYIRGSQPARQQWARLTILTTAPLVAPHTSGGVTLITPLDTHRISYIPFNRLINNCGILH